MSERLKLVEYFISHFSTAAIGAIQQMEANTVGEFIEAIDDSLSIMTLQSMLPTAAAKCIETLPPTSATKYLNQLNAKDAAAILRYTDAETRNALLKSLSHLQALRVSVALRFQNSLIGAWIDTSAVGFHCATSISEAKKRVIDDSYIYSHVFVVNDQNEVAGVVLLLDLMQQSDESQPIVQIMKPSVTPIYASLTLQQAVELEEWRDDDILPVIDRDRKLVGIVRFIDLWNAIVESSSTRRIRATNTDVLGITEIYCHRLADLLVAALSPKQTTT